jgi:uncharacterized protein
VRKFLLIGFILVAMAGLQVAYFAFGSGDEIKLDGASHTLKEWRSHAVSGDKVAEYVVGDLYRRGEAVVQNAPLAFEWLRKSAEQGEPRAQLELGQMYRAGFGTERNDVEAVKWLRLAAEQGKMEAAYDLGYIYERGEEISTDDPRRSLITANVTLPPELQSGKGRKLLVRNAVEAARWYRLAAEHGHTGAMLNLGNLYRDGRGVEKNGPEAVHLFKLAAASARTNKTDPTPAMAAINLAVVYEKGHIVPQDYAAAAQWAEDALASPALPPLMEIPAAELLAGLYSEGHGVVRDEEKAQALKARATEASIKLRQQQVPRL